MKGKKIHHSLVMGSLALVTFLLAATGPSLANTPPEPAFSVWRTGETVVSFDASPSRDADGRITGYQWTFGDGTSGSGITIEHAYPGLGSYSVTLVVTDDGGSAQILTKTIDISQLPTEPSGGGEAPAVAVDPNIPVGTSVGERAPDFALPDFTDQIVHLSDFLGKVVLLEFWKSTCPHCVASTPYLEELRENYEERAFVVILVILNYNPAEGYLFLMQNGYTGFVTVRELDPSDHQTAETYGISVVPRAFLIDRSGVIRYSGGPGGIDEEMIDLWL